MFDGWFLIRLVDCALFFWANGIDGLGRLGDDDDVCTLGSRGQWR